MNPQRIINFGLPAPVAHSAITAVGSFTLFTLHELAGFRYARLACGWVEDVVAGSELAIIYKVNIADSAFPYLDGVDGPFIDTSTQGAKDSGWQPIDPAAYAPACGVYLTYATRGGDDVSTIRLGQIFLQLAERI